MEQLSSVRLNLIDRDALIRECGSCRYAGDCMASRDTCYECNDFCVSVKDILEATVLNASSDDA